MGPFTRHLVDAIKINRARRPRYGRRTRGRSRRLSDLLIWFEYGCLPFARYLDHAARPWQQRGIEILEADLMPMHPLPSWDTPPTHRGVADRAVFADLGQAIGRYRGEIRRALRNRPDFAAVADASAALLDRIEQHETEHGAHFAMARHFVESIGLGAAHATDYVRRTDGAITPLCRRFLAIQALGLPSVLPFDRLAQPLHRLGVGILVNDVPAIPFRQRWDARRA